MEQNSNYQPQVYPVQQNQLQQQQLPIIQYQQYQPVQPMFQDQAQFNLVKAKNRLLKWTKCQLYSSIILVVLGVFSFIQNLFVLLTIDSWCNLIFENDQGEMEIVKMDQDSVAGITILKLLSLATSIYWGYYGIKTFKPILKQIEQGQMREYNQTKNIWAFRKKLVKIIIVNTILIFITCYIMRDLLISSADEFIDQYYKQQQENQTNNTYLSIREYEEEDQIVYKFTNSSASYSDEEIVLDLSENDLSQEDVSTLANVVITVVCLIIMTLSLCCYLCISGLCFYSVRQAYKASKDIDRQNLVVIDAPPQVTQHVVQYQNLGQTDLENRTGFISKGTALT